TRIVVAVCPATIGKSKAGMVQDVRCICPKLHTNQLRDFEVFAEREVDHVEPGSDQTVPAFVAERSDSRECKSSGVVPSANAGIAHMPIANYIWKLVSAQCFRVT